MAQNVVQTIPSPATWNVANTKTSTSQMLDITLNVESAQQGTPAISNVTSISVAGVSQSAIQLFKWS